MEHRESDDGPRTAKGFFHIHRHLPQRSDKLARKVGKRSSRPRNFSRPQERECETILPLRATSPIPTANRLDSPQSAYQSAYQVSRHPAKPLAKVVRSAP